MSTVYLVHTESGECSDWTFDPRAVFTSRERAVAWIEGQRVELCEYPFVRNELEECWNRFRAEPTAYGYPSTTDGQTWEVSESEDGRKVRGYSRKSWYIDELVLDPEPEVKQ